MSVYGTVITALTLEVFLGSFSIEVDFGRGRNLLTTPTLLSSGFAWKTGLGSQRS